jgi:soluble cytochrome b562
MLTRNRSLTLVAGAAFGLLVAAAWAQPTETPPPAARQPADQRPPRPDGQPGQEGRGRGGSGEITNVNSAMKVINRSFRQLKDQIADPEKKEESLKLVGDIQKAVVAAKSMPVPAERRGGQGRGPGGGEGGGPGGGGGGGGGGTGGGAHDQPGGALAEDQNEAPKAQPQGEAPKAPPKEGDQPKPAAPADPKRTEDFRRELVKLLKQTIEIEQDLLDGKFDQAKTELGKIPEMRDDAHKELGVRQGRS